MFKQSGKDSGTYEELAASTGEVMEFYRLLFNQDDELGSETGALFQTAREASPRATRTGRMEGPAPAARLRFLANELPSATVPVP